MQKKWKKAVPCFRFRQLAVTHRRFQTIGRAPGAPGATPPPKKEQKEGCQKKKMQEKQAGAPGGLRAARNGGAGGLRLLLFIFHFQAVCRGGFR